MRQLHKMVWPTFVLMAAVTGGLTVTSPVAGQSAPCVVRDTSGTPLNIRSAPNGRVFATVRNGVRVMVLDYDYDRRGRQWALILFTDRGVETRGWVIRRYVAC